MPTSTSEKHTLLLDQLRQAAVAEGLSVLRCGPAHLPVATGDRFQQFLDDGHHGSMTWMEERVAERSNPQQLWPMARSALMLAQTYGQDMDPMARLQETSAGIISVYALNRDYHDVFKGKLKRLAQWLHRQSGADVKIFVDTAPLMEKPLGEQAGLGWQGKHTNLVSREMGSWFFIGTILTTLELPHDAPESDHCGSCRSCLDICPTKAFPAPYQLDARRCISYLTIEHKGPIARAFRKPMGNRIYGCDDCLAVCPWNKFATLAQEAKLVARDDLKSPPLAFLLTLDGARFRSFFSGSPVKRSGRDRFIRNCLIAAGNSRDLSLLPAIQNLLRDGSALVRGMAVWALKQLAEPAEVQRLQAALMPDEQDAHVLEEWTDA